MGRMSVNLMRVAQRDWGASLRVVSVMPTRCLFSKSSLRILSGDTTPASLSGRIVVWKYARMFQESRGPLYQARGFRSRRVQAALPPRTREAATNPLSRSTTMKGLMPRLYASQPLLPCPPSQAANQPAPQA
jgi:hypothetical protein